MSPFEFWVIWHRHEQQIERNQLLFGLVASQVINFSHNPPKEQIQPMEFFKKKRKAKGIDGAAFAAALDRNAMRNGCEMITIGAANGK